MTGKRWYHRAFDAPYLEVYAHRDATEAQHAARALLTPQLHPGDVVVDLACGAGRWLLPVESTGARAIGLDLSRDLLEQAARSRRESAAHFALLRADMLHVPLQDACCDMVLSLFTSFGYFETPEEDGGVLREARRILRPQGTLLLDVFNAHRLRRELVPESQRVAGRYRVHEKRHIDADRNVVVKDIELRRQGKVFRYREQVRLWERDALVAVLQACGFDVRRAFGDYDGAAFDRDTSPRLILQASAGERPSPVVDSRPGGTP